MIVIDAHASHPTSPASLMRTLKQQSELILELTKREVIGRYKGSMMGLAWSLFIPMLMLAVYTFVFSEIFKAHWGSGDIENRTQFALLLFVGMIVLNFFNEVLNRSPSLILANVNYVKKVIFPLEILPVVVAGAALFNAAISMVVLLAAQAIFNGALAWTVIYVPIIFLPLVILATGLAWILASIGVFLRDIGQAIVVFTTMLTFLSPVFYPIAAVPEKYRPFIMANPMTFVIEQLRDVVIWGRQPFFAGLFLYIAASILITWASYAWFQKTRRGFADVI